MIRIISVDDHTLVRRGLAQLVSATRDISLVGEANNGRELMQLLKQQDCDVIVMDISMPGKDGLVLLKEVKSRYPRIGVLMLSMHPEDLYAIRALRAGTAGYVCKDGPAEQVIAAIRKIAQYGRYIPPGLGEVLAARLDDTQDKPPHETLSDREFAVLCRIGRGRTVSQIAEELFLSVTTVSTYRARLLNKLNVSTTTKLIHYAVSHHLSAQPLCSTDEDTV